MYPTRSFTFCCLVLIGIAALSGNAFSTTVAVGSCTSFVNFATIQQAVNAVPSGSTIKVCPGTYHEQVTISQKLTLTGIVYTTQDAVVISPPPAGLAANTTDVDSGDPIAAQLLVQNTDGPVTISNLTVDGTGNKLACGPDVQGILFQSASGTVNHVAVRNQIPNDVPNGCQVGKSIVVEAATGLSSAVTIENSSVHGYNKNGITAHDAGTTVTITGNYVQGSGVVPSGGAAQNGIEIAFGAKGKIANNTVIDNIYGDTTIADSTDILLYDAAENGGIVVSGNTAGNSQIPIAVFTDTASVGDGVSVTGNKIFGVSTADGIDICTNGNTVTGNTIFNSAQSGVHLDASCGTTGSSNMVKSNTILESSCAGILTDPGTADNTTTPNNFFTVPLQVTSSTSSCTIPGGPARAASKRKFSPAK